MMRKHPRSQALRAPLTYILGLGLVLAWAATGAADEKEKLGEQIYQRRCLSCHGKQGEGSKEYGHPLRGDKSIGQLSKYIAKSMPDDDPGTCTGEEAEKVAAYIHDAFYSKTAQARNKPAQIELSRLTVRQYQNTIADLIGGFRGPVKWEGPKGLHGEYFKTQRFWKKEDRIVDRVDPTVQFDFGVNLPDGSKTIGHRFAARWEGSVLAPDTGDYEFIVRTEHSTRLWVNDVKKPLIDRWVKSGNDTEFRESIHLLGGRVYPIRLEFSKGKQGVDDSKKKQDPPPVKASIALLWKPPQQAVEVIPQRCLSPSKTPETMVLTTPFPPDDRSSGYERGTSISKAWDQACTDAALEVADYVAAHLEELAGANGGGSGPDDAAKLRDFAGKFAERAFRRPLSAERKSFYVDRQFQAAKNPEAAVKRVVLAVLMSPRFLYHELNDKLDAYDVACRISYGLWDSLPDRTLLEAAAAGKLSNQRQIAEQAQRMVGDLQTRGKVREFLFQWLRADRASDIAKDPKLFPDFTPAVASDLRTSLDLFLEEVVWDKSSDFRRLLLEDDLYLNGRLAKFYGAKVPADSGFQKVKLDEKERAGLVTHPYLMAIFAYTQVSSPIHRGVFLSRGVLGRVLPAPPAASAPLSPDLHAGLTTRQRVDLQTSPKSCQVCHVMINPLGFSLEHFDAVGRFRKEEKGKPIDSAGGYQSKAGETVAFAGARDLATYLAGSEEVHAAFVQQLFHYLVKQPINAFGPREAADLRQYFERHEFNVRELMVEMIARSALTPRSANPKPDSAAVPVAASD